MVYNIPHGLHRNLQHQSTYDEQYQGPLLWFQSNPHRPPFKTSVSFATQIPLQFKADRRGIVIKANAEDSRILGFRGAK